MLDFTHRPKKVLEVKLSDGRIIKIGAPKKKLFTRLTTLETTLKNKDEFNSFYDDILSVTADVLSSNSEGIQFTADEVDNLMDIEDTALLLREYAAFAGSLTSAPN